MTASAADTCASGDTFSVDGTGVVHCYIYSTVRASSVTAADACASAAALRNTLGSDFARTVSGDTDRLVGTVTVTTADCSSSVTAFAVQLAAVVDCDIHDSAVTAVAAAYRCRAAVLTSVAGVCSKLAVHDKIQRSIFVDRYSCISGVRACPAVVPALHGNITVDDDSRARAALQIYGRVLGPGRVHVKSAACRIKLQSNAGHVLLNYVLPGDSFPRRSHYHMLVIVLQGDILIEIIVFRISINCLNARARDPRPGQANQREYAYQ